MNGAPDVSVLFNVWATRHPVCRWNFDVWATGPRYTISVDMIKHIGVILLFVVSATAQNKPALQSQTTTKPTVINPALAKSLGNYGYWWNALTEEQKDSFIDGFSTAMERATNMCDGFAKDGRKKLAPGESFDEQISHLMLLEMLANEFNYKGSDGSLKTGANEFYREPLNQRIPVAFALSYIRDQLEGKKSPGQLLDELLQWRKIMNGKAE